MSRFYDMTVVVRIKDLPGDTVAKISNAIIDQWEGWEDPEQYGETLTASGQSNLCGGESEEEFTDRVYKAIFEAAGQNVPVIIRATFLEEVPYNEYQFNWKEDT